MGGCAFSHASKFVTGFDPRIISLYVKKTYLGNTIFRLLWQNLGKKKLTLFVLLKQKTYFLYGFLISLLLGIEKDLLSLSKEKTYFIMYDS